MSNLITGYPYVPHIPYLGHTFHRAKSVEVYGGKANVILNDDEHPLWVCLKEQSVLILQDNHVSMLACPVGVEVTPYRSPDTVAQEARAPAPWPPQSPALTLVHNAA
jgi:hypothetical protein